MPVRGGIVERASITAIMVSMYKICTSISVKPKTSPGATTVVTRHLDQVRGDEDAAPAMHNVRQPA
jgi:hypothetical protein